MNKFLFVLFLITILFTGISCALLESGTASLPTYQNQIFRSATLFDIQFPTNGNWQPWFSWTTANMKYMVIGIYSNPVSVKDDAIQNPQDMVWTWNTGITNVANNQIFFSDGRDVAGSVIQTNATALSFSNTYYIAAWAYDSNYNLVYSTVQYTYTVTNTNIYLYSITNITTNIVTNITTNYITNIN